MSKEGQFFTNEGIKSYSYEEIERVTSQPFTPVVPERSAPSTSLPPVTHQGDFSAGLNQRQKTYNRAWWLAFLVTFLLPVPLLVTMLFVTSGLYCQASFGFTENARGRGYIRGSILALSIHILLLLLAAVVLLIFFPATFKMPIEAF